MNKSTSELLEEAQRLNEEHQRKMTAILAEQEVKMRWWPLGFILHKIKKGDRPDLVDEYLAEQRQREVRG